MSEVGGRGSEVGDRDRLDTAIDLAVREMLDVEPPAGFRRRVVQQISDDGVASAFRRKDRFGRKIVWIAAPLAAAAILVLAALLPSRSDRTAMRPTTNVATVQHTPVEQRPKPAAGPSPQMRPHTVVTRAGTRPSRTPPLISAAVVPADTEFQGAQVEALAGPAPLGVERLAGPPTPSLQALDVAPIQIRALEVPTVTETPRERREE